MNYEKKYKESLERAKEQLNGAKAFDYDNEQIAHNIRTTVYNIFPKLKESEDEKMRKSIIYALRNGGFYNNDKTDEALAWLEKQGEQKSINDTPSQDHWQDVRKRAAIAAMQGLLAQGGDAYTESVIAKEAIIYADALVKILKGE